MKQKYITFNSTSRLFLLPLFLMALSTISTFGSINSSAPVVNMPTPQASASASSDAPTTAAPVNGLTTDALSAAAQPPSSPSSMLVAADNPSFINRIMQRGKLIVALHSEDHSPFHMRDEAGTLIGIDIEIAQEIGRNLNVPVEFNRDAKTFDDLIDIVAKHKADISISKLSYTPKRANKVRFTLPYIKLHQAFIISRLTLAKMGDSPTLTEIFSDSDHQLGVMGGTSYVLFAKEMLPKSLDLRLENDWDVIINKLVLKEFVGAFRDDNEIRKVLIKRPEMNLSFVSIILKSEEDPICIAVPQDEEEFAYWLNSLITHNPKVRFELSDALKKYKQYL